MDFPSASDFLDVFGVEPIKHDVNEGYLRYV